MSSAAKDFLMLSRRYTRTKNTITAHVMAMAAVMKAGVSRLTEGVATTFGMLDRSPSDGEENQLIGTAENKSDGAC